MTKYTSTNNQFISLILHELCKYMFFRYKWSFFGSMLNEDIV
ncbi:MAG: hypothetical protein Q8S84_06160 [bacterium]|nr:hypothetical protein [bacterium]